LVERGAPRPLYPGR